MSGLGGIQRIETVSIISKHLRSEICCCYPCNTWPCSKLWSWSGKVVSVKCFFWHTSCLYWHSPTSFSICIWTRTSTTWSPLSYEYITKLSLQKRLENAIRVARESCRTVTLLLTFFNFLLLTYLFLWVLVIYFLNPCMLTYTCAHACFILFDCLFACLFIPYYLYLFTAYAYAKNRTWLYFKDQSLHLNLTLLLSLHVVRSTLVCLSCYKRSVLAVNSTGRRVGEGQEDRQVWEECAFKKKLS